MGDRLPDAGAAVHVHPLGQLGGVPDAPEGDEGHPVLEQPPGPGVAGAGVGQDEAVDQSCPQHVAVRADDVVGFRGEDHEVAVVDGGGRGELHQELVEHVAHAGRSRGVDLEAVGAGLPAAQLLRGDVESEAEPVDLSLDALERPRSQLLGVVQGVADRLARDAGGPRDVDDRGPSASRCPPCHDPPPCGVIVQPV